MSLCRWEALSLCRCAAEKLCRYVAMSLRSFVAMSLCRWVALSLCRCVAMSLCRCVSMSLCRCETAENNGNKICTNIGQETYLLPAVSKVRPSNNFRDNWSTFSTELLYWNSQKQTNKQTNCLAAGTSKWTDIIPSSAVVYCVIKDAYKAIRSREQDNELLTHATAVFTPYAASTAQSYRNCQTSDISHKPHHHMCRSFPCIWFIPAIGNLRITPVPFERRTVDCRQVVMSCHAMSLQCRCTARHTTRYKYKQTRNHDSRCPYTAYKTVQVHQCCISRLSLVNHVFLERRLGK
jgi:hypothetical protein